jgi:hypothetical protein
LFFFSRRLQGQNDVLSKWIICHEIIGGRVRYLIQRRGMALADSWRFRNAGANLNDSSILPIYGRNRASNLRGIRHKAPRESALSIEVDASNRPA